MNIQKNKKNKKIEYSLCPNYMQIDCLRSWLHLFIPSSFILKEEGGLKSPRGCSHISRLRIMANHEGTICGIFFCSHYKLGWFIAHKDEDLENKTYKMNAPKSARVFCACCLKGRWQLTTYSVLWYLKFNQKLHNGLLLRATRGSQLALFCFLCVFYGWFFKRIVLPLNFDLLLPTALLYWGVFCRVCTICG